MTETDFPPFGAALTTAAEAYGEVLTKGRLRTYFSRLSDFDLPDVLQALSDAMDTERHFPRIAVLRKLLMGGDLEDQAFADWTAVLREVRRVGWCGQPRLSVPALATISAIWGTWEQLCAKLPAEGPGMDSAERSFTRTYADEVRRDSRARRAISAHSEAE